MLTLDTGQNIRSSMGYYYKTVQWLGAGGNSVVYLVHATSGEYRGVLFALKVFTRLSERNRLDRFHQEAAFLRQCTHPSIMRIYDNGVYVPAGERKEYPFVIVDYLPNTLFDLIRGSTTSAERISYTLQLLSALSYLAHHIPPVVHRDIKPRNIFIKGKSCVLGDFGLMKFMDAQDDVDHQVYIESVGTGMPFFYRTPDLIAYAKERIPLSAKSDVFQLGLVTAQAFTGWNPQRKVEAFTDELTLESIRYIPGTLGPRIKDLIEKMLTNDPTARPSANDLIDPWEGIFREVVDQCQRLEGRVF
jgi:serine/threonine protein kinase